MSTMTGESTLTRFTDVQVYAHGLLALSILLLWVTGLPITFHDPFAWLMTIVGYDNVVLVHVAAGAVLILTSVFYLVYGLLGMVGGVTTLSNILPGLGDIREAIEHMKYLAGRRGQPASGKYTFLQKAEVWIIVAETTVMIATGVILYAGTLNGASPAPAFLITRDIHAIVAVTMLVGVTFHLFMTHAKEFPLDRSMFTGNVTLGRACDEWEGWVETSVGYFDVSCSEETHTTALTTSVIVGMILFGVVWTGIILEYVLSPVPTGGLSVAQDVAPNAMPGGVLGTIYAIGLNIAMLVVFAAIVALAYGFYDRWTVAE
ncbi:cytochrome b subunit of formate dehydrogenase [Halodesulfurarchaeum formicicum]|uniref:Cytochrome b subunit of formate dehydrogenase n=1 Tax=Halodesulfurarchaeum formicicum TaxID=1873524 RepID=A0A1D8S665_9EURY|nr:cytochrome b/b6 domain-containing protein [Halodesulfurarchaeum formicicum]AOW80828.1 cytochrome b subunit of formate dehydrogenase [Halodesulfurarchaeum formicicum]APE96163.1 cytochrome b subunit of formate dehydrogenase [Halodesulfurarchaeum formicicum]